MPVRLVLALCALLAVPPGSRAKNRVLVERGGPKQARLYISNADGSREQPLTKGKFLDYDPAWSPKGDWIAFTSERAGPADLYRIHPDGSGLEQITSAPVYDDQAAFSPDEKRIVFVSTRATGRANLWILDLSTRKARRLTRNQDGGDFRPSWSPNGKWIAFSSDRGSSFPFAKGRWERLQLADIYLIHPDGSGLKRITHRGGFCGSPKWTPDSKSVVAYCMSAQDTWTYRAEDVDGNDELVKVDIASGETTPIPTGPGVKLEPSVLPSGGIAYLRYDKTAKGVFYGKGSAGPVGSDLRGPSWSPDGRRVVYSRFIAFHHFGRSSPSVMQWSRNKDFDLYDFSAGPFPAYDRSGKRQAVTVPGGEGGSTLYIKDRDQPRHAVLKRKDLMLAPQWSPDGKRIVMSVGRFPDMFDPGPVPPAHGEVQVAIVNADGSGLRVLTSGSNDNAFPSFSPDGKRIVYHTRGAGGQGLRIMNLETRSVRVLTRGWDNFPEWSPRGDLIEFTRKSGGSFNIFTIHPDGTGLKQLTHTHGNDAHAAWSPDGMRIVFASSRMGFKDEAPLVGDPQPYGEIFVMRYDGTHVEQLTDDKWEEGAPEWRP